MMRKAFVMNIHPGMAEEYRRRHSPIPDDLAAALKAGGATNYSIFLDEQSNRLFAYVEVADDERWNAVAETEACRRWWAEMAEIMPSHPDNSPVSIELDEVFHLD